MSTLFHFIQMRPIEKARDTETVAVAKESAFQDQLRNLCAREPFNPEAVKSAAEAYRKSEDFADEIMNLKYAAELLQFVERSNAEGAELSRIVTEIFGSDAKSVIADADFDHTVRRVADTIVALKILSGHYHSLNLLLNVLRGAALLTRVAACDPTLREPNGVRKWLQAVAVLPASIFPLPMAQRMTTGAAAAAAKEKQETPVEAANRLEFALRELLRVTSVDLEYRAEPEESQLLLTAAKGKKSVRSKQPGLKAQAVERLSKRTKSALDDAGIAYQTLSWADCIARTRQAFNARLTDLNWTELALRGEPLPYAPDPAPPTADAQAPLPLLRTHGHLQPAGWGDLIVVQQHIKQYEMGEIAHIENVLKSENKERTHIRREYIETTTVMETEAKTEKERDLESTERFEMERETTQTIQEQESLQAGATISVAYGSFVEFTGSFEYATESAREESSRQASQYAREVTQRSAERIAERVREERLHKVINEIEETNRHGFNNTAGDGHVVGIYQWVDKVYEAQAFQYHQRLLFDTIVPEPGAFLQQALAEQLPEGTLPAKPRPFLYTADQITEVNYRVLAARYGVKVSPPPQDIIKVVLDFKNVTDPSSGVDVFTNVAKLAIDDNFRAVSASLYILWDEVPPDGMLETWLGNRWLFSFPAGLSPEVGEPNAFDIVGELNAAVIAKKVGGFAATYEITCALTDRAFAQWQIDTHAAIMDAYLNQQSVYDQALAALLAEKGSQALGRSPAEYRRLERDELRKFMLSMITNQDFSVFNSIETAAAPGTGYLQLDVSRAETESPYIRFFEQAFEWVNMMYVLLPYFWSRKEQWVNKLQTTARDSENVDFLRAGAARVVLPVRPGFEAAVLHFLETGEVWQGGPVPDVTSRLYLPILEEIKEHSGETSEKPVPYGDPWEIRVPTSLLKLRETSDLPRWEKQADGAWQPVSGA